MRVLLIFPSWQRPGMHSVKLYQAPPLSLETLAALTPDDIEVSICDENAGRDPFDHDADLVGISVLTAAAPRAYQIAASYRGRGIPVVLGGFHPTFCPEEAGRHADAVVVGEAESVWPRVVADARRDRLQPRYRGEPSAFAATPVRPVRSLVSPRPYLTRNTVETSRGCPNRCHFCSVSRFYGGKYRRKPVDHVVADLRSLPDDDLIWFVADNFPADRAYAMRLIDAVAELGMPWICQASVRIARDRELLGRMAEGGCVMAFIGFETIDPAGLASVNKAWNDAAAYPQAIRAIHDHGISILGSFMFGLDSHTPEVFDATVDFCIRNRVEAAQFSILTPWPGTPLYAAMEREGRLIDRDWSHYDGTQVVFRPRGMAVEQLQSGFYHAYNRFYSLSSIARRFLATRAHRLNFLVANLGFRRARAGFGRGASRIHAVPEPATTP
ncbi:MAG: radical SAM protein [Candidatus Brocadiia bacterium]